MSVYIKGMEMPTSCGDCKAFVCYRQWAGDIGDCFCGITKSDAKAKEKNADCPLVPVPKHGRLIDADALKVSLVFAEETAEWAVPALRAVLMVIDEMPAIIPADKEGEGC